MSPGITYGDDTIPMEQFKERRRPPSTAELMDRLEGVEEKVDNLAYALGIDNLNDKSQLRRLGRDHEFAQVGRSFCEQVGWKFLWAVGAIITGIIALNLGPVLDLFKK